MGAGHLLTLILAPPALGALVLGLAALASARREQPLSSAWGGWLASVCALASFALSIAVVAALPAGGSITMSVGEWIHAGPLRVTLLLRCDALTAVMLMVVTGVGSLIHLYAVGYMTKDAHRLRFFCYLNLFLTAMLLLVTAGDLLALFAGWEGVGLCSYLLIGFWHRESDNAAAGMKAFVVNRVGDVGVLVALCLLAWAAYTPGGLATLDVESLARTFGHAGDPTHGLHTVALVSGLLLLVGVAGKSAQVPLSVWLPDAMAGPTPVSALIHAATMVTAGVYLLARLQFLYVAAPVAGVVVMVVGATTALVAGISALGQRDLKRVLAYSTVSQLGFMVAAAGALQPGSAMFHVVTHAFFKAALFLGAGIVIHAAHDEQDLGAINGRAGRLPVVKWSMLMACLALAGCPPLAGFWSKEGVLASVWAAAHVPDLLRWATLAALAIAAVATAAYATRLWICCFVPPRGASRDEDLHAPGLLMNLPVAALAFLAVVGGALSLPFAVPGLGAEWLHHFLGGPGAHAPHPEGATAWLVAISLTALAAGVTFGALTARRPPSTFLGIAGLDATVRVMGQGVVDLSRRVLDPFVERGLIGGTVVTLKLVVYGALAAGQAVQGGRVRVYALAMALAVTGLLALAVWR